MNTFIGSFVLFILDTEKYIISLCYLNIILQNKIQIQLRLKETEYLIHDAVSIRSRFKRICAIYAPECVRMLYDLSAASGDHILDAGVLHR